MGTSYRMPVRLSVIVNVSAMLRIRLLRQGLPGDAVLAREPPSQVGHLAAFAAEGPPRRVYRSVPAVDAQRAFGGAQNPLIVVWKFGNRGIWRSRGNLEIWKSSHVEIYPDLGVCRFPDFQIP